MLTLMKKRMRTTMITMVYGAFTAPTHLYPASLVHLFSNICMLLIPKLSDFKQVATLTLALTYGLYAIVIYRVCHKCAENYALITTVRTIFCKMHRRAGSV